jgi:hypothetical protein
LPSFVAPKSRSLTLSDSTAKPKGETMASTVIKITYSSVDGAKEVKRFGTVIGASEYARRWIGDLPTLGSTYVISGDGIGKIEVTGASLTDLFPAKLRRKAPCS